MATHFGKEESVNAPVTARYRQKVSFSENCNWRDVPFVLEITPKPVPRTTFAGRPKLTRLKTLKNSRSELQGGGFARAPPAEGGVFNQSHIEVLVWRAPESVASKGSQPAIGLDRCRL